MTRGTGRPRAAKGGQRLTKNQRRLLTILARIPPAREQLIVAIEDVSPAFEPHDLFAAARSPDPRERNKVDTIERGTEKLINWVEELAARALSEGLAAGVVVKGEGGPWQRLADLEVITRSSADRLREAKDTCDDLAHAYPPESYRALHDATKAVLDELDNYLTRVSAWAIQTGILPPSVQNP